MDIANLAAAALAEDGGCRSILIPNASYDLDVVRLTHNTAVFIRSKDR